MSVKKVKLDEDGHLQRITIEDVDSLIERLDSLDYKLWELLKIANAFAKKHNLEIEENE